jgi:hypothetical protein
MAEKRARDPHFTAVFALLVTAIACAFVLLARPRAIIPAALPPLVLSVSAVEACLDADRKEAASAPKSAGLDAMYQGFLAEGLAERGGTVDLEDARRRQDMFANLATIELERAGAQAASKLRAQAVERFMKARAGEIADANERDGLLGSFEKQLERYGLTNSDGAIIAPVLSVRAMYKSRWNLIHARERSDGLSPIEIQAFEGWIALHGLSTPPEVRAKAARAFREAGGKRGALTLAIWLFQGGALDAAEQLFREESERGELFVRNYQLALNQAR